MEYPDCFPENFEKNILPKGAKAQNLEVYHILLFGNLDKVNFLSSYELDLLHLTKHNKPLDQSKPGTYSTSCFIDKKDADYYLELLGRHHPKAKLSKGRTEPSCGLSQITKEREPKRIDSHVDWWLYKNNNAHTFFEEV